MMICKVFLLSEDVVNWLMVLYININIRIYIHIVCIYTYIHKYIYTCIHVYIYAYIGVLPSPRMPMITGRGNGFKNPYLPQLHPGSIFQPLIFRGYDYVSRFEAGYIYIYQYIYTYMRIYIYVYTISQKDPWI